MSKLINTKAKLKGDINEKDGTGRLWMRKKDEPGNHLSHVNGTYKEIQTGVQEAANEYYRRFKGKIQW